MHKISRAWTSNLLTNRLTKPMILQLEENRMRLALQLPSARLIPSQTLQAISNPRESANAVYLQAARTLIEPSPERWTFKMMRPVRKVRTASERLVVTLATEQQNVSQKKSLTSYKYSCGLEHASTAHRQIECKIRVGVFLLFFSSGVWLFLPPPSKHLPR